MDFSRPDSLNDDVYGCLQSFLHSLPWDDLYRRIFEASQEPIMVFDGSYNLVLVNDAAREIYGLQGSWAQKSCHDIFQDSDCRCESPRPRCWIKEVAESGQPTRAVITHTLADGKKLYIGLYATPIVDDARQSTFTLVYLRDVTCEFTLQQVRNNLHNEKQLSENAPEGLIIIDGRGIITNVNETWLDLTGYARGEIIGTDISDQLTHDQKFFCDHILDTLRKHARISCTEMEWRRKDASTFWSRIQVMPMKKSSDTSIGIISIRDIEEIPLDEDAIDRPGRFTRALLDSIGEGILIVDTNYRILNANKRFTGIRGLPYDKIIGRHCYEVSHGVDIPCWQIPDGEHECPTRMAIETGRPAAVVHRHVDEDKHHRYIEVKSFPLKDRDNEVFQVIETHTDITERKELEERIQQAEKMESLGTMAGGIAHDLNNLLTPIIGNAELVLETSGPGTPFEENLHEILDAANRAADLIRQILAFSRRQVLNMAPANLNCVIDDLLKLLDRVIHANINIQTYFQEDLWTVSADKLRLEQIIINLVTNARDAMPEGGNIIIETRNLQDTDSACHTCGKPLKGSYVLMQISDEGTGIPPETMHHIFDPFFTTKETGHGTGMGLSTVLGIIHQHDGHVNVYSEAGQGSIFKIFLPRMAAETKLPAVEDKPEEPVETKTSPSGIILVVDDNHSVNVMLEKMLIRKGYSVLTADSGEEALEIFSKHAEEISLVISDVVMPGMGGRELLSRIHRIKPDMPCLYMSGYSLTAIHQQFIQEQGNYYLQKPPSMKEFLDTVKEILNAYGSG